MPSLSINRRRFLTSVGLAAMATGGAATAAVTSAREAKAPSSGHTKASAIAPTSLEESHQVVDTDPSGTLTSKVFLSSAQTAVLLATSRSVDQIINACNFAAAHGVPVFVGNPTDFDASHDLIKKDLKRLKTKDLITFAGDDTSAFSDFTRHTLKSKDDTPDVEWGAFRYDNAVKHPNSPKTPPPSDPTLAITPKPQEGNPDTHGVAYASPQTAPASVVNALVGGATLSRLLVADPRATSESIKQARDNRSLVGLGNDFGNADQFGKRIDKARNIKLEQHGGGGLILPGRMIIALYGVTTSADLGALGEQGKQASIDRIKKICDVYSPLSQVPVIPAFELIVTVASSQPEDDGSYSRFVPQSDTEPWIDAINAAGGYAIIDLQPGFHTLLDQAKKFEKLLKKPFVGLALDPEWKLYGDERPMGQIGHVSADEINEVTEWLDKLVEDNNLPQKSLVIHQFQLQMIRDRENMIPGTDNINVAIHVDGSGPQSVKMDTWNVVRQDLSPLIGLGWKNFYDEDKPMATPEETMAVVPTPNFVSYQ